MECKDCTAFTKNGSCKRRAACNYGCKNYCWQHARMFGGVYIKGRKCKPPPKIKKCPHKLCKRGSDIVFPCKKKRHVFNDLQDVKEYCDLRRERPRGEYPRSQREIIAMLATDILQDEPYVPKRKYKRRVRFSS